MPSVLMSPLTLITQLLSDQGIIGSGFKINTYVGGSVSTPQTTYTDSTGTVTNANPIVMGSNGRLPNVEIWAVPGTLIKAVVTDALNNPLAGLTLDNIPLLNDVSTLTAAQIGAVLYPQTAAEIAAGVTPVNYAYPYGHAWRYGVRGTGSDVTTQWNNWIAAIAGAAGYLPVDSGTYVLTNGFTVTGHTGTRITADPLSKVSTPQNSGYFLTMANCLSCDFQFGFVSPGYSGVIMTSTANNVTENKVGFSQLNGAGRQGSKPTDPMANRIGVYVQGPTAGNANYYNTVKDGTYMFGFDTGIAFQTPSGGIMNSNGNTALRPHIEGFWFGVYTNCTENQVLGARFYNTTGTDGTHLAECVRIGDGTYATNFNYFQGVAEPGANTQFANCLASSLNNIVIAEDNCDHSPADAGNNQIWTKNTFASGAAWTLRNGLTLSAPSPAADTLPITAAAGKVALQVNAAAAGSTALRVVGQAAGTAVLVINTSATTGAATPTLGSNKPGAGSSPAAWIPIVVDGSTLYIPAWS